MHLPHEVRLATKAIIPHKNEEGTTKQNHYCEMSQLGYSVKLGMHLLLANPSISSVIYVIIVTVLQ